MADRQSLRLALLAGSLGRGGAEKQGLYLARELVRASVEVRVFALTEGDPYERPLEEVGATVCWAGRYRVPLRITSLVGMVRAFHPDIVQALHFFTNLYAVAAARVSGCVEIGSIRNDTQFDMAECGRWGVPLLRAPRTLLSNSRAAAQCAERSGVRPERIQVLTNVLDVADFDRMWAPCRSDAPSREVPIAIAVARLVPAKRLDRFLRALARARRQGIRLRGAIAGDGPERPGLEALAGALGLFPEGVVFFGERHDVPRLLAWADMLVLTSQHEGFPNVLLEAMAAHLPVVTTAAGDAASLVRDGRTGFVVPFDDEELLCARLTDLAVSPATRHALGCAGRRVIEEEYRSDTLAGRALRIYQRAARQQRRATAMRALETLEG
jgi:glycosyltransferase involved in cell wall biosynthesis